MLTKAQLRVLELAAVSPITAVETIVINIRSDVLERLTRQELIRHRRSQWHITPRGRGLLRDWLRTHTRTKS